jgi:hypothetical protein
MPAFRARLFPGRGLFRSKETILRLRQFSQLAVAGNHAADLSKLSASRLDSEASESLRKYGTLTFDSQLGELALQLGSELKSLVPVSELSSRDLSRIPEEHHKLDMVFGSTSMQSLIGNGKPVANIRFGVDSGMIDFYNVDNYFASAAKIREHFEGMGIREFLEEISGTPLQLKSMNAYVNSSVESTRGFHVDAYGVTQYKLFVYLTDVKVLADGPYCYVLESSNDRELERVNRPLATAAGLPSTDLTIIDFKNAVPILAKSGTAIISDQGGAHRGYPQEKGHFRAIAVFNYFSPVMKS